MRFRSKVLAASLGFALAGLVYFAAQVGEAQWGTHGSAGGLSYTLTSSRPCSAIVDQAAGQAVAAAPGGILLPVAGTFTAAYGAGDPTDYILIQNTGGVPMYCEQDETVLANIDNVHLLAPGDSLPIYRSRLPGQTPVPERIGCAGSGGATTLSYYFCRF